MLTLEMPVIGRKLEHVQGALSLSVCVDCAVIAWECGSASKDNRTASVAEMIAPSTILSLTMADV